MRQTDSETSLGMLLHDVARLTRKRFEQRARTEALGLTRSQAAVLAQLSRNEGINQAALAQILEIEPITLVRLLDKLESLGMVERRPDPRDRRAHTLHLTAAARPMLSRIRAVGAKVLDEALAGLPQERRETLREILLAMKANLTEDIETRSTANG